MSYQRRGADDVDDAIPMVAAGQHGSDAVGAGGAYAFREHWGDDDGRRASHGRGAAKSKCVFCMVPFAFITLACLAAGITYGTLAMRANSSNDFDCDLIRVAPPAAIGGCAGLAFVLLVTLFAMRSCWYYASMSGCTKGRVCASVFLTVLIVLCLVASFGAGVIGELLRLFTQQQPSLDGTVTFSAGQFNGLPSAPVSLVRDANGIVHIEGANLNDVVFGQGFAQATDRLWQLEFFRLVGKGELSRHVGDAGLSIDKQTRTLGVARAAKATCAAASTDTLAAMAAFAAGVNAFLQTSSARPVEFYFMSESWWPLSHHEPEPFTAFDCCFAAKLLQLNLGDNMKMEIDRFRMWWLQGPSATGATYNDITSLYFNQTNITGTILDAADLGISGDDAAVRRAWDAASMVMEAELYATTFALLRAASAAKGTLRNMGNGGDKGSDDASGTPRRRGGRGALGQFIRHQYDMIRGLIRKHASNAWAASQPGGSSSHGSAMPCGASDPHLDINLPSVWYYNHIAIRPSPSAPPTWEASGVSMTGIPGVHIGKTSTVSWGITMAITDIQDLYVIIPDPSRPTTHYMLHDGTSLPFSVRTEVIEYKDGFFGSTGTVTLQVLETIYGPNIVPVTELPADLIMSLQSVILQNDTTSADAVLGFSDPTVVTVQDLCAKVFRQLRSPTFSVPMADASGNIGYCISGAYRVRPQGHTGMWPTIGDGTVDLLPGEVPSSALPHKFMSAAEMAASAYGGASISAANQKIYPDGYPIALGYDYIPPFRGARAQELLAQARVAGTLSDVATHRAVQSDIQSNIWVVHIKPMLLSNAAAFQTCLTAAAKPVLQTLMAWDGRVPIGSTEASALWGWLRLMNTVTAPVTDNVKLTPWSEYMFVPSILLGPMDPSRRAPSAIAFSEGLCATALAALPTDVRVCGLTPLPLNGTSSSGGAMATSQCWALAAAHFNNMVAQGYPAKVWGTDLSQLHAVNLMMDGSPLECMFNRRLPKDGDVTSVDVSEFVLDDNPTIFAHAASSMRQLYDWNSPSTVQFAFPGGMSGYPYSPFYFNLASEFAKDEYVAVVVQNGTGGITAPSHSQTLV